MNEKFSDEMISAYLDGELSQSERAVVEQHLESSDEARQELDDFRSLSAAIRGVPHPPLPVDFAEQVMRQAERRALLRKPAEPAPAPRTRAWWKPTIAVAAVAAAVVFFVQTVPQQEPQPRFAGEDKMAEDRHHGGDASQAATLDTAEIRPKETAVLFGGRGAPAAEAVAPPAGTVVDSNEVRGGGGFNQIPAPGPAPEGAVADDGELRIPDEVELTRKRVGDVIEGVIVNGSQEEVAVVNLYVLDVKEWVTGFEYILHKSSSADTEIKSEVVAVYLNATPEALVNAVAQLDSEGKKLLEIEEGIPVAMAELPKEPQLFYAEFQPARSGSSVALSPPVKRSAKDAKRTDLGKLANNKPQRNKEAQTQKAAPQSKIAEAKEADQDRESGVISPQDAKHLRRQAIYTPVPAKLQPQLKQFNQFSKRAAPKAKGKPAQTRKKVEPRGEKSPPKPVRVIFLVQQRSAQPPKAPGDGGGAA